MMKFRKWIFKFLTGHDLIEYQEVLDLCARCIKTAEECQKNNHRLINETGEVLELAKKINVQCVKLLERCKEVKANENTERNTL